ncbi:MAG: efflux RND transporter periplasmic adaptor subunit [Desulfobacterales bacterium]|nr:efflux RND transporter periplasmic adaptor subunit [Desulfobacterales bacterium]
MMKNNTDKPGPSTFRTVAITVAATLALAAGGAYFSGYLNLHRPQPVDPAPAGAERRIAYWKAPMNPTEIYDKPGKSAMGMDLVPVYEDELKDSAAPRDKDQRRIAYWKAPMNPTEIYDKPGKSAMGMDLVPVYESELVGGVEITVDPVVQQNMGLRTALVEKGPLVRTLRTYGHITYDETRTVEVSSKVNGWVEKIHVNFTGKPVKKGDPLFDLYSPELFAAQEEYLAAYRNFSRAADGNRQLPAAARQRLRYFDVAEAEIEAMEASGKLKKTVTIRSPFDGVIILKNAEEGTYIKTGTTVFRVADLSRVWVDVHIFEYELPWVTPGIEAEMTLPYLPGKKYQGKVSFMYPYLQRKTRDVVIRFELENPALELKPDMYADVRIKGAAGQGLSVPSEAVIRSGERNIVFVLRENNKFTPRDVTLGLALDGQQVQVLTGLGPGEVVVTSGQFLMDSESKLKEAVQKMMEIRRQKIREKTPEAKIEKEFFKELEKKEDFFKDLEKQEDFFKDLESD